MSLRGSCRLVIADIRPAVADMDRGQVTDAGDGVWIDIRGLPSEIVSVAVGTKIPVIAVLCGGGLFNSVVRIYNR